MTRTPVPVQRGNAEDLLFWATRRRAEAASSPRASAVREKVAEIIGRVRRDGDRALRELAKEIDGVELREIALEVPAESAIPATELSSALRTAAANIEGFCRAFDIKETRLHEAGVDSRAVPMPYDNVGVYAPGGRASYPSTVLMCCIPAIVAGVRNIEVCTPRVTDAVRWAASLGGAKMLHPLGGPAAIAAMAYGTESIARCDKVVGPGNEWVVEAKRQVRDVVGIESLAGPSEVVVVADGAAEPSVVTLDLLAQLEHGPGGMAALITTDASLADRVSQECAVTLASTGAPAWMNDALFVAQVIDPDVATGTADRLAPEHVSIQGAPEFCRRSAGSIRHAGTVFVGSWAAVAFGDYCAGPSHVLPTGGAARFSSPLSPLDFVRWTQYVEMAEEGASRLSKTAQSLAREEGLTLHAESILARSALRPQSKRG